MEIWTRRRGSLSWVQHPGLLRGLLQLADSQPDEVLLVSERPVRDRDRLRAALLLIPHLVEESVRVIVASPHPSAKWIEGLAGLGVDAFWVVSARRDPQSQIVEDPATTVCPELHTKIVDGRTLSVCGCRDDRLVLARSHLDRWCLGREACPHRRLPAQQGVEDVGPGAAA